MSDMKQHEQCAKWNVFKRSRDDMFVKKSVEVGSSGGKSVLADVNLAKPNRYSQHVTVRRSSLCELSVRSFIALAKLVYSQYFCISKQTPQIDKDSQVTKELVWCDNLGGQCTNTGASPITSFFVG
jgi:hypothetical protein